VDFFIIMMGLRLRFRVIFDEFSDGGMRDRDSVGREKLGYFTHGVALSVELEGDFALTTEGVVLGDCGASELLQAGELFGGEDFFHSTI
jgi:hypothetical protein